MNLKVSPDLVRLLESAAPEEYDSVLARIVQEVEQEVKRQVPSAAPRQTEFPEPRRARFSFD